MKSELLGWLTQLKAALETLQATLNLTRFAVKAYEHETLARSLSSVIDEEAERCYQPLRELLKQLQGSHRALALTPIRSLWPHVWRSGTEEDGTASFELKLRHCQRSLGACLAAVDPQASSYCSVPSN